MRRARLTRTIVMVAAAALLALGIRGFVAVPRSVPSESMMPTLLPGDVFLALRWPFGAPLARWFGGRSPRRGEVVVVATDHGDVVKRVIGLPGDRVALRGGAVILNGRALPRYRVADALLPVSAASPCGAGGAIIRAARGAGRCRVPVWRERLASGLTWNTLDRDRISLDDMPEARVPAAHLFLLGDNRDRSADSRIDAADGGLGMVPMTAVRGRASVILWSSDGTARLRHPATWWPALRRDRIAKPVG